MNAEISAVDGAMLVDQAPDGMIFADRDGVIRVWNPAAERIFGYAAEAAIGRNLDIIIPENLREAHWTGYERALAAGDTKYRGQSLPTKALKADGSQIYVELSFAIVHGGSGEVVGAMAQARDITERFERDRAMRRRLRELEKASDTAGDPRAELTP
ncbi:MAG: PAS domain S-box protein [Chloroflexota bacterium]|nr:PAS domain S-box protein [Chloroflexota bacterium]